VAHVALRMPTMLHLTFNNRIAMLLRRLINLTSD
jgi:hypothetical protein